MLAGAGARPGPVVARGTSGPARGTTARQGAQPVAPAAARRQQRACPAAARQHAAAPTLEQLAALGPPGLLEQRQPPQPSSVPEPTLPGRAAPPADAGGCGCGAHPGGAAQQPCEHALRGGRLASLGAALPAAQDAALSSCEDGDAHAWSGAGAPAGERADEQQQPLASPVVEPRTGEQPQQQEPPQQQPQQSLQPPPQQQQQQQHQPHQPHQLQQQQPLHWQHTARLQQQAASQWLALRIGAADSWQDVAALLDAHEASGLLTPRHLVLLIARLDTLQHLARRPPAAAPAGGGDVGGDARETLPPGAAVPTARHEQAAYVELVTTLLRMVGSALPCLGPAELPVLLAAASRLPLVSVPKPWVVRVVTRAHHLMPRLAPHHMARLTWALGRLGMRLRPDFAARLLPAFKANLAAAPPRALAVMAHGLARAGAAPDAMWVAVFADRAQRCLPGFSGRDLAMCMWGLAQLRHPVPASLLRGALRQLVRRLPRCSSHEASLVVWALGRLGYAFPGSTGAAGGDGAEQQPPPRPQPRPQLPQRQAREQQQQQQQQAARALRRGRGGRPARAPPARPTSLQEQLLAGLAPRLGSMSGRQLTTLLYGLALCHAAPPPDWAAAALAAAGARLGELDGQGLANLVYAVGLLRWRPGRAWQAAFWAATVAQVQLPQPAPQGAARRGRRRAPGPEQAAWGADAPHPLGQPAPGLAGRSWEQLHEAQRLLGWRLPLQQLQQLQARQQLHRLGQAQLRSWALQAGASIAAASGNAAPPRGTGGGGGGARGERRPAPELRALEPVQRPAAQQREAWRASAAAEQRGEPGSGGAGLPQPAAGGGGAAAAAPEQASQQPSAQAQQQQQLQQQQQQAPAPAPAPARAARWLALGAAALRALSPSLVAFLLGGVGALALLFGWARGSPLRRCAPYTFTLLFESASKLEAGTPVRMKGVQIGSVRSVALTPTAVAAVAEVADARNVIPRASRADINLLGLASDPWIDITPPPGARVRPDRGPHHPGCPADGLIVCAGGVMPGSQGGSTDFMMKFFLSQHDRTRLPSTNTLLHERRT
ncbi:TGD2 [Scenedesmus sp. PABB004]|nr:TGD2 [Scenedesmus sp. PABB004]